ncbi:MAG: RHS repeat-associated core domain-containing protein [Anaerolineae bacterium]|nr:RHS repeat-associated core domain-containing protein [Anaerolineae bacterium]
MYFVKNIHSLSQCYRYLPCRRSTPYADNLRQPCLDWYYDYTYDAAGNRTAATAIDDDTRTYTYDSADRIATAYYAPVTVHPSYDNRGNLLYDGTFTYTYDGAGRMVKAESITTTAVYTYNGDGLRVAQHINGAVTTFTWDQALDLPQVLATSDGVKHLYGLDRIGVQQNGTWYTPLPDALGSVRQWAHATGAVVGTASYTPFGVPTQHQGLTPAPWGFSGEWHDAATGLQYLRARWYQPQTGRFTQVDPFPGVLALPGTQHPYSYGLNNPTRYTDPSGEIVVTAIGATLAAIALISGGVAAIAEWAQQVDTLAQNCNVHFWEAALHSKHLNWGAIGGTFAGALVASLLGGIMGPMFLGVTAWGIGGIILGGVMAFGYGVAFGIVGDLTSRIIEAGINGTRPEVILSNEDILDDIKWGGGFSLAGYGLSVGLETLANQAVSKALNGKASHLWWDRVTQPGKSWQLPLDDGTLPANDLVTAAYHHWSTHPAPSDTALVRAGVKLADDIVKVGAPFEILGDLFDMVLNDDAWNRIVGMVFP